MMALTTPTPFVSDRLRERLRRSGFGRTYQDVAEVKRPLPPERRRDRSGGSMAPTPDTVAVVPVRLTRGFVLAREQLIASGLTEIGSAILTTAPDVDIRATDQLLISNSEHPEWPLIRVEVTRAEVRRTKPFEQVITGNVIGGPPPPPIVPLST